VAGPSFGYESSNDDDGFGEGDKRVDRAGSALGADRAFLEAAVVPGVRAFDDPSRAANRTHSRGDDTSASEGVEQVPGLADVVAGVQVHRDLLGPVESEPPCQRL